MCQLQTSTYQLRNSGLDSFASRGTGRNGMLTPFASLSDAGIRLEKLTGQGLMADDTI
jgi:hypothetical protein